MICQITGRVERVCEETTVLLAGGIGYELLIPVSSVTALQQRTGEEVTLHTIQYLEGNPAGANLIPRLIGFIAESDRDFFQVFTRVRGVSNRRALRAMSVPCHQIAAAIEHGDVRLLTSLPEIGKKTATQIVSDLQGQLTAYLEPSAAPPPAKELNDAQRTAVDILVHWGDRRADAERWVAVAVESVPDLTEPDAIVREAYRIKQQRQ